MNSATPLRTYRKLRHYPQQSAQVGQTSTLSVSFAGPQSATLLREDLHSPFRSVWRLPNGQTLVDDEPVDLSRYPAQTGAVGQRVEARLCFDESTVGSGLILRADEHPDGVIVLQLDDGRVLLDYECQIRNHVPRSGT
jgi:hypothetical protein